MSMIPLTPGAFKDDTQTVQISDRMCLCGGWNYRSSIQRTPVWRTVLVCTSCQRILTAKVQVDG